jgi:hypothetical protein
VSYSPQQPWGQTPPPPPPPKGPPWYKHRYVNKWTVGGAACLVTFGIGGAVGSTDTTTTADAEPVVTTTVTTMTVAGAPTATVTVDGPATTVTAPAHSIIEAPTVTVTERPKPSARPGPKRVFGDGVWLVGRDIAAGTYTTSTAHGCYWERDRDLTGGLNSILANDLPSGSHTVVTILPSDKAFDSERCGTWHKIG